MGVKTQCLLVGIRVSTPCARAPGEQRWKEQLCSVQSPSSNVPPRILLTFMTLSRYSIDSPSQPSRQRIGAA